jgi:GT2 family glycosyltransferase
VVIPVHNSSDTLERVVPAVLKELRGDDRITAVDDRSDDKSVQVLNRLGVPVIASERRPGAAGTRNAGGLAARTRWILFLDSDAVPPPGWRAALESAMARGDAVQAVYGPKAPGRGAATFYKNYYYHHTFTRRIRGPYIKGCGTFFFAVDRKTFGELNGFDENIAGATIEDADFSERLWARGGRIVIAPEIQVHHLRRYTLREFFRYEWNMMRAKALYILRRDRDRGAPSISVAGFSEMLPVTIGAVFSWAAAALWGMAAAGVSWAAPAGAAALAAALAGQIPFWLRMVGSGGLRGVRAGFLILPDLLLILPACVSAAVSAMAGKRY